MRVGFGVRDLVFGKTPQVESISPAGFSLTTLPPAARRLPPRPPDHRPPATAARAVRRPASHSGPGRPTRH